MLLLGVPLHTSEVYRVSGGFAIDSPENSLVAAFVSGLIHSFRMQAFFLISGFFAAMVISRKGRNEWLKGRLRRLAIPLVLASLLLAPLEQLLRTFFTITPHVLDSSVMLHASLGQWIGQRWFLLTLLIFCIASWAAWEWSRNWIKYVTRVSEIVIPRSALQWTVLLALLVASSLGAIALGKLLGDMLFHEAYLKKNVIDAARYLPFFFMGVVVYLSGSMDRLIHLSRWEILAALMMLLVYLCTYFAFYPEGFEQNFPKAEQFLKVVRLMVEPVAAYFGARLFFAIMATLFKNKNKVVDYLVDASLCIYLVHMTFVMALTGYLLDKPFNATLEMLIAMVGATLLSLLAYEVVKRSNVLSWILNGKEWRSRELTQQTA